MTERELIRAAARGDQEAFAQLVRTYENQVYHLSLRLCGGEEDAKDVAQEAFLDAWKGLPNFRGEAGFSTWLYRLTTNAAIDHLRKTKRQKQDASLDDEDAPIDLPDVSPGPQARAEGAELKTAVGEALQKLSDDHRQVLVLREMRQLTYEEISSALGIDVGTVKSRLSRARAALRGILVQSGNLSGYLPSNGEKTTRGGGKL